MIVLLNVRNMVKLKLVVLINSANADFIRNIKIQRIVDVFHSPFL